MFNFVGPNNGDGLVTHYNGEERSANGNRKTDSLRPGLGEIVIGEFYGKYSYLMMDELLFFNRKLTLNEIQILYNVGE